MKRIIFAFGLFILGGAAISFSSPPEFKVPWDFVCILWAIALVLIFSIFLQSMFKLDDNDPNDKEIKEAWKQVKTHGKGIVKELRIRQIDKKTDRRIRNIMKRR